jgi:hypothetical protein
MDNAAIKDGETNVDERPRQGVQHAPVLTATRERSAIRKSVSLRDVAKMARPTCVSSG